jgi:23S rRNA (adenine2503-C2)-methyltransferase
MIKYTIPSRVFTSAEDLSVNFVWDIDANEKHTAGALEARYVRRTDDYFIVYLSSQSGCNQACRFCHLTATKQVGFDQATLTDYLLQAETVLAHYDQATSSGVQVAAKHVNFNWMARGEPLLNPIVTHQAQILYAALSALCDARGLTYNFNLSTIVPQDATFDALEAALEHPRAMLFYSLYSMQPAFRRRWLPKAKPPEEVLQWLAGWQKKTGRLVTLHWAFIQDENDSAGTVDEVVKAIETHGIHGKFNLVRYNPFSIRQGAESSESVIEARFATLKLALNDGSGARIVPRVGFDVKASCGMFVHQAEIDPS